MEIMQVGANIAITGELAETAAYIAKQHPDHAIVIRWVKTFDETEWLLTATDGVNDHVYLARDDSRLNYIEASNEFLLRINYPHPAIEAQKTASQTMGTYFVKQHVVRTRTIMLQADSDEDAINRAKQGYGEIIQRQGNGHLLTSEAEEYEDVTVQGGTEQ